MMTEIRQMLVFVIFVVLAQLSFYVTGQERYLCNDNVVLMASNNRELNRCNYASTQSATWEQAWDYCHAKGGWMVNCPSCSEGQGAYIGEELLAYNEVKHVTSRMTRCRCIETGVKKKKKLHTSRTSCIETQVPVTCVASIWSGLHIETDRLVKDNFPTTTALGELTSSWNTTGALRGGQCVVEEYQELDCGDSGPTIDPEEAAVTGEMTPTTETDFFTGAPDLRRRKRSASLPDDIPENCVPVYRQRIVPCNETHTFACYFSGIPAYFIMDSFRREDVVVFWYEGLDRQFFVTTAKGHLDNADDVCGATIDGARALRERSEASHRVILGALSDAIQSNAGLPGSTLTSEDLKRTLYWYHHLDMEKQEEEMPPFPAETDGDFNEDLNGRKKQSYQGDRECQAALLSFSYSGSELEEEVETEGDNFAIMTWPCTASLPFLCELPIEKEQTLAPVMTATVPLDFVSSVKIVGNEVQFPSRLAQESPYQLWCSIPKGFGPSQSITAYRNGEPIREIPYNVELGTGPVRIITEPLANPNPIFHMNLYHCEVNNKIDNKIIKSNEFFVRITDYEVYTLHIAADLGRQYQTMWNQIYRYSLAGDLDKFTGVVTPPPLDNASQLRDNIFMRLVDAIGRTELWQAEFLDFITTPTPHLVLYISSFVPIEDGGDFEGFPPELENEGLAPGELKDCSDCPQGQIRQNEVQQFMTATLLSRSNSLPELNLTSIHVYSIESCWPKNITVEAVGRDYSLPETTGGAEWTSPQTCAHDGAPLVSVLCQGSKRRGFHWGEVQVNPLCDYNTDVAMDSEITEDLKTISQENVTKENVEEILDKTKELTDQITDSDLQPIDVTLITDILQKSSEVTDLTPEQANEILATATRISSLESDVLKEAQRLGNAANRMIKSVDEVGSNVEVSDVSKFSRLVTDNLAVEVWDLTEDYDRNTIVGLKVLSDGNGETIDVNDLISLFSPSGLDYGEAEAAILLPKEFIESQLGKGVDISVRLAMNVYAETSLYQATNSGFRGNTTLNSKVIAAKVLVNGVPITDLGPYNVTTVFLPKVRIPEEDRTRYSTCAWWDFDALGGYGAWSDRGCSYQRTESGRDVCVCDHLTNFAILVSFYDQESMDADDDLALGIISIVGLVLSIVGLSLSILSFLCIKKLRQGRPQQTLFNLSIALLMSWVTFLVGIGRTENHAGCIAVAATLHYLIMASFMWMLMEGILQYLLFVKVMNTYFTNYMVKTAVPAWGLPVIPVMVVLAIDPELYRGGENYCWMSLDAFYYAFAIPVGAIILTNLAIFVMVVYSLCKRKDMTKHSSQSSSQAFVNFRASFICFFILGLSWIFGFLTIEDARTVFQYIFCISASLQGFVIFLMMTARDKTVRAFWKNLCCRACMGDKQKGKTYRTWGDKGTGSSSNSGVQSVARHNKTYMDSGTSQTGLSSTTSASEHAPASRVNPGQFPMGVKGRGYGNEESDLDNIHVVAGEEEAMNGEGEEVENIEMANGEGGLNY